MNIYLISSIVVYMVAMLFIGYYAYKRTSSHSDYMLGGRGLTPGVAALSAGASDMSGWLMMGLPGAVFVEGFSAAWIAIGLTMGAYINWLYVAPRLRTFTEVANNSITIPGYFENRFADHTRYLRIFSSIVIFIFFTVYVASGMVAGGVLFENVLGMSYQTGIWVLVGVTIAYTLFGGFLAVSWTDVVQGMIMMLALVLVPVVTLITMGGPTEVTTEVRAIDPSMLNIFTGMTAVGIISFLGWGLGYFGQPHIIIRFMALTTAKGAGKARRIGMSWMIVSLAGAVFTGLIGLAYYAQQGMEIADPETIFIQLGDILFHPIITGFILSAILAAVMSTISSQLLVTASSLTDDLYKSFFRRAASDKELVIVGRLAVLLISAAALLIAWIQPGRILDMVSYAWAGFGASFGPVILMSLFWRRMNAQGALAGIISGAVVVLLWSTLDLSSVIGLSEDLYEIIPGFIVSVLMIYVVSLLTKTPSEEITNVFDEVKRQS
ncbi:sodium/proline symporter PutP [Alkalicoccobacillus porphyridii]|uniref:Sodium/proline symporter n=1 Tax=Alkalicoccobacillus porphyridii TaxID=2597270 RepID=A0A553ZU54_9BACI|nr:sodium/proline symporter PutP [Alkalicoccobacillus porphyridii]TSB44992.1 sodium/proline symporter PutP [Alkalicoccobacillus porphyridii]